MAKKILILAANPNFQSPINIDSEVRHIQAGLRGSKHSYQFQIEQRWAVQLADLRQSLLDEEPTIVHFCGHGSKEGKLLFEDQNRISQPVSATALAELFSLFSKHLQCVILNACYSHEQAEAISTYIPFVIGMRKKIDDSTALEFSKGFYDALGAGRTYKEAFRFGCNAISLAGLDQADSPQFKWKAGSESPKQSSSFDVSYNALIRLSRADIQNIINFYKKATLSHVVDPKAHFCLGLCYLHLNMKDLAQDYFEKVISIDPGFTDAYYYKALCLIKQKSIKNIQKRTADEIARLLNLCLQLGILKRKYLVFLYILNYGYYISNGLKELKPNIPETLNLFERALPEKDEIMRLINIFNIHDKKLLTQLKLK